MFSAGMGIGLMFYGVGEPLSHMAAPPNGAAQAQHAGGGRGRHGVLVLPLGAPSVGDLRGGGPRARLLRPPQGRAEPDLVGVPPADRRPRRGPDRSRHRRPGDLRDAVRQRDVARPRRPADHLRHGLPLGRRALQRPRGGDHRRAHRDVHHLRRLGRASRRAVALERQHGPGRAAADVPAGRRPDGVHLRHARRVGRRLRLEHRPALVPDGRVRRPGVARRLDDLLLGVVDLLGALRRHVHRPHLEGADRRRVRPRRAR